MTTDLGTDRSVMTTDLGTDRPVMTTDLGTDRPVMTTTECDHYTNSNHSVLLLEIFSGIVLTFGASSYSGLLVLRP